MGKQNVLSLIGKTKKLKGKKKKKKGDATDKGVVSLPDQHHPLTTVLLENNGFWGIADILGIDMHVSLVGQMKCKFRPNGCPVTYSLVYYQILNDAAYCVFQMGANGAMLVCANGTRGSVTTDAFIAYAEMSVMRKAIDEYEDALALGGYVFDDTQEGLRDFLYIKCPAVFELGSDSTWVRMEVTASD
jgi:hypothetical protein